MTRAVALFLLAELAQAADFLHPRLKSGEAEIGAVVILPAIAEMTKRGVKGTEGMGAEEEEAGRLLTAAVSDALTNRGLSVENPFTEEALQGDNELKYAVADVQRRFDQVAPQLFRKQKDVRKGRFTLGDSVAVLNPSGAVDALIVIRAEGTQLTKGKGLMTGGLVGMARSGKATFRSRVALIDTRNGDILFLGAFESQGLPRDKTYEKSFQRIRVAQGARPQPAVLAAAVEPQVEGPPVTITLGQTTDDVEKAFGKPKSIANLGTKTLYFYENLKITFISGKVSDVE